MYHVPFLHKITHMCIQYEKMCGTWRFSLSAHEKRRVYVLFISVKTKPVEQVGCAPRCSPEE